MQVGTFRDRIAANRRNSLLLIAGFLGFVTVFGYVIGYAWLGDPTRALFGLVLAFVVGTVSGLVTYYGGDRIVLAASRAKEITHDDAPVLFNVVEEMTIASGVSMPKVYIIEDSAPNAFATGRDPEHASVAVTSGLLEKLNRDELQGVIAHEMSHVGNYDIRYAMLVGILVGTTVLISDFFLRGLWFGGGRGRQREGGGQIQLIMIVVAIVLAVLLARSLVQSLTRLREGALAVANHDLPGAVAEHAAQVIGDQQAGKEGGLPGRNADLLKCGGCEALHLVGGYRDKGVRRSIHRLPRVCAEPFLVLNKGNKEITQQR